MNQSVRTSKAPLFNSRSVQARICDDYVFTSGIVGVDPVTLFPAEGFEAQARLAIEHLITVSAEAKMSPKNFVRVRVYLRDMIQQDIFNSIFAEYVSCENFPVISIFALPALDGPYLFMIEAFGVRDDSNIKKEIIHTSAAPTLCAYPYPQGIKIGNFLFTSSQLPIYSDTGKPEEEFEKQIHLALQNMIAVVEAGGASKENIMKNLVLLKDKNLDRFDVMNGVYGQYFTRPARSCYGASGLYGISEVATECIAYMNDGWKTLYSTDAPTFSLPLTQGAAAENLAFISGMVAVDPKTGEVAKGLEGEMRLMMTNALAVGREVGAEFEDWLKTTLFLTDIGQSDFTGSIFEEYFKGDLPAGTTYQVYALAKNRYLVEFDVIARTNK